MTYEELIQLQTKHQADSFAMKQSVNFSVNDPSLLKRTFKYYEVFYLLILRQIKTQHQVIEKHTVFWKLYFSETQKKPHPLTKTLFFTASTLSLEY